MTDYFIRDEDEKLAEGATHMDDIDLLQSQRDGALVAVAVREGKHACWQCGGFFNESNPKLKKAEIRWGHTRIMLHAQCESGKPSISVFFNNMRGMQVRRKMASAARASQTLVAAASEAKNKIFKR